MVTPTEEQIARLPKWARAERERYLQANANLRQALEERPDGPEVLIYSDPYAGVITKGDKPRPVGTVDTTVEFFLTPDKDRYETVTVKIERSGQLAIASPHRRLQFEPRATNLAYLTLRR